ncbi:MAG TPA: hypothetical protein VEQ58_07630, partial [Polyangiaceae bacterium]|nr:hypothetical protein [Polyangiaceae bacterium]
MKLSRSKVIGLLLLAAVLAVGAVVARKIVARARRGATPLAAVVDTGPRVAVPLEVAETIYDGKLSAGWDDWGWGPHRLGGGPAKLMLADYGGWLLHHADLSWRYGGVAFRFRAPTAWGNFLQVGLRQTGKPEDAFPVVIVEPRHVASVDGWQEVLIGWKELNPQRQPFDRLLIASRAKVGNEWAELDHVVLTKPSEEDKQQGQLKVLCDAPTRPISELIYGSSEGDWSSGQTAQRIGGNPLSRDNWELGAWNTGNDWFFENHGQDTNMFQTLAGAAAGKRTIAMVVPMLG